MTDAADHIADAIAEFKATGNMRRFADALIALGVDRGLCEFMRDKLQRKRTPKSLDMRVAAKRHYMARVDEGILPAEALTEIMQAPFELKRNVARRVAEGHDDPVQKVIYPYYRF